MVINLPQEIPPMTRPSGFGFPVQVPSSMTNASMVAQALVSFCVMDVKALPHDAMCGVCGYMGDLRSFACVARALVTDTHWHGRVDQLWPGAATVLFGTFAFQVRALLARASAIEEPLRWIDPSSLTARHENNCVLFELKQGGVPLWRSVSQIVVRQPSYNCLGLASEEIALFDPPSDLGEALERVVISWWRQAGEDWPPPPYDPVGLTEFHDITDLAQELTVWLQVWYKMDDTPRVLRPSLNLSQVRWEDISFDDSAVMQLHFDQHLNPDDVHDENEHFGTLELEIDICRKLFSVRGMDGQVEVHMHFAGFVDEKGSYLTSGYLSKLKSVCS